MLARLLPLLILLAAPLQAAEGPFATVPEPPPLPESVPEPETGLEPEVIIKKRKTDVIEEYRINGQLYMVKIIPKKGYPYYLIDADGDGSLETHRSELERPNASVWTILRW